MATAETQGQFTGKHMFATLIAFFGVIIGVNLVMAYFANSTWSGLVVANGYVASQSFDRDLATRKAQDALGWNVALSHAEGRIRMTFMDNQQAKIEGLTVRGQLERTVTDKEDQTLDFASIGSGVYSAPADLAPGLWEVEIDARKPGDEQGFRKIFRFVVKD